MWPTPSEPAPVADPRELSSVSSHKASRADRAARVASPSVERPRSAGKRKATRTRSSAFPARVTRTTVALTGIAAAATGLSVVGGLVTSGTDIEPAAADLAAAAAPQLDDRQLQARTAQPIVSRSDRRGSTDSVKVAALSADQGHVVSHSERLSNGDPRDIARALLGEYGFDQSQFSCLDSLYVSESNWRVDADNPTSSAYGIPQALTQLHDLPADYMTSAESQIRWGLEYIQRVYGTPCNAWEFKRGHNWY
jgi:hypothetical protein